MYGQVADNVRRVREAIEAARAKSPGQAVRLVAVSKTHPAAAVRAAFAAGLTEFGENRVQEALPKMAEAGVAAGWHLVGHLQHNKAGKAAGFDWVQSIDSLETAARLGRYAAEAGRSVQVLVEVNTSGETAKHGLAPDDAESFYDALSALPGLAPRGLMTVGPLGADEAANRRAFALLRSLRERIAGGHPGCVELSMGMSGDFAQAIAEGSTIVRIGTAIFGTRDYS